MINVTNAGMLGFVSLLAWSAVGFLDAEPPGGRERADTLFKQGNYKDAYDAFRGLAIDPKDDPRLVGMDLHQAVACLTHLGRSDEVDAFREEVVKVHGKNWRLLQAAAESYLDYPWHYGRVVAGKFHRGDHQSDGRFVHIYEKDRARAMQLLVQGLEPARRDDSRHEAGRYLLALGRALMGNRMSTESWRLQTLTPLDSLPDDEDVAPWGMSGSATGAPVRPDGSPVYYAIPRNFPDAKNDGERWRWALNQAAEIDPGLRNDGLALLGAFCLNQFGTQTLASLGYPRPSGSGEPEASGIYALDTLKDEETIARLASGVRRFTLPDEFNPIRIFQAIAEGANASHAELALHTLASVFENRRQFDRAAEYYRKSKDLYGDGTGSKARHLAQILGNWGRFEPRMTQPAGRGATVDFRFRTGRRVHFEASEIRVEKLLSDVKEYLGSRPTRVNYQQLDISNIGARLVALNQAQYRGATVARWDLDLDPPLRHFDRVISVTTPLQKAGAYLLKAEMENGNTSFCVVWLDDTVIVRKPVAEKAFYFVADARSGKPVPGADLDLFGWRMVQVEGKNEFQTEVKTLAHRTDGDGQLLVPIADMVDPRGNYQWLITARTGEGRFAHLGYSQIWPVMSHDPAYDQVIVYAITDRPVYRPGQPVRFKLWVARSRYDQPDASEFAGKAFAVEVQNPKGEKVFTGNFTADAAGGFDGSFELATDSALGVYRVEIPNLGGGWFRVEEYKKPEFEVNVEAPARPVMLGEKVSATIKANYYFGSPVSEARVKYKITRTRADNRWYPAARWDWLFGPGYWWFAGDYTWYPGWSRWGVVRPAPWWYVGGGGPPELVAEAELPIRPDGTLPVEIDTALAKAIHPDEDQRYEITAEVTDQSRRTIVGTGTVLVARKPFTVYTWLERGHYRAGDTIEAGVKAQTLDRKPVAGKGTLALLKVSYDAERRPVETLVERWDLTLDAEGQAGQTIKAAAPGQYRLSATIDDGQGHTSEGGYLFTVAGQGFDGAGFRYNDLEIIPDRKEYQPGDTLRLMINTNRADSTVLLFLRPTNGVYLPPKVVRIAGKSTVVDVGIVPRDMPNLFVEALTVSGGRVHDEAREIAVPPSSRIVNVAVEPAQTIYKPGRKARVKLKLTGPDGKPFAGSTVLAVYDKAVEAISGGSNVPDIKEFFWKWKRSHHPQTESSLDRWFGNEVRPNDVGMGDLGIFGGERTFDFDVAQLHHMPSRGGMQMAEMFGGFGGMGRARGMMAPAAAAPMALEERMEAVNAPPSEGTVHKASSARKDKAVISADEFGGDGPAAPAVVRTNFADTAYWNPSITANADGTAEVDVPLPESLTTWKVKSWTLGPGTRVGQGEAEVITSKDLLVRLQAPRFFVQKDEVVLSANVHSKLKSRKPVQVVLELDGSVLQPLDATSRTVEVAAGGEQRVDWRVRVAHEGQAIVRMKAITDEESDAAQMTFPAYVHGMLKMEAFAGTIRPDQSQAQVVLNVPAERRPEQSRLEIRYSPTLAGALVDALPYLADYPYGCTEQTLNRFLPTVITQKVLIDLGLDLAAIRDKRTNLNAQELGDAKDRAKRWKTYEHNPVFDRAEVSKMASAGLQRLADMQLSDGGWGWFSGFGEHSSPHTTALVVHGLQIARQNDLALPEGVLDRGQAWLAEYQAKQVALLQNGVSEVKPYRKFADDTDALVFMVATDGGVRNDAMLAFLDRDRTKLSVYAKALFGLALEKLGEKDRLAMVLQNISQYVVRDDENQTAFLKLPSEGYWWYWYGSEIETDAFYLKLLARTDPKGELAPRLVKYVLNSRKHGAYWNSTRDTAFCIEALADYLKASGEDRPDMTVSITVDGKTRKDVRITPSDLFRFDNALVLEGNQVETGKHTVSFVKQGRGPLYFNAYLTNFTLEDPITRAGLEIKVDRKVYRLIPDNKTVDVAGARGEAVGQKVERYRREPLSEGATLTSGELVEVELEIDSKNDYEYLLFEDYKAAGFEPVEVRSGYNGNDLGAYVEFRDERVAFFSRTLSRGKHSVSYRLRAEVPGKYHALPARAQAMYAPELRGNSDEIQLRIEDREAGG